MLPSSDYRKQYGILILFSAFFLVSAQVFANDEHQSDTLKAYINTALSHNPVVLQRYYEYQAALQKVPQVGSLPDPELTMGIFLTPMELVNGKQAADLKLMQMFPWFGVLRNARDEMSMMAKAKFELFRDAKLQVIYDVQRTWFEMYKLKKEKQVTESNLAILKLIEKLALIKYQTPITQEAAVSPDPVRTNSRQQVSRQEGSSGMTGMAGAYPGTEQLSRQPSSGGMSDGSMTQTPSSTGLSGIYLIKSEAGDLQNNIVSLESSLETLKVKFNLLLNRPVFTAVFVADTLVRDTLTLSLSNISDSIPETNPMLSMALSEKQALEARRKMVSAMGFPMVGLGVDYSVIQTSTMSESKMNGRDMIMPMVSITIPVYRKKYNAARKEAELQSSAATESYKSAYNSLRSEYAEALGMYEDAARRAHLYREQSDLAGKSLDLLLKSYSVASDDLTSLLRARQRAQDYRIRMADAAADLSIAVARIKRLLAYGN